MINTNGVSLEYHEQLLVEDISRLLEEKYGPGKEKELENLLVRLQEGNWHTFDEVYADAYQAGIDDQKSKQKAGMD